MIRPKPVTGPSPPPEPDGYRLDFVAPKEMNFFWLSVTPGGTKCLSQWR